MIVSNMEIILGKHIKEHLGLVQGGTVRTKHFGREFLSSHPDRYRAPHSAFKPTGANTKLAPTGKNQVDTRQHHK